jgi:protoporphyrinogen/coproporphyrinogen III oxidase
VPDPFAPPFEQAQVVSDVPSKAQRRVAVIGGGISGLAAAHRLLTASASNDRPLHLELFEASDRLGGSIGTERLGDFLVETGPDMFVTDKPWAVELIEELGLAEEVIGTDPTHRRSLVLRRGHPEPVPPGFTLMAAAKVWPVLTSRVLSPMGKARLAWERFVPRRPAASETDDESLASFVRRRMGREVFERLVQPLVGGIYTADPETLSLRATLPRFLDLERDHGSLTCGMMIQAKRRTTASGNGAAESGARYGLFVTLRGGLCDLVAALERTIRADAIVHTGMRVTNVARSPDGWTLTTRGADARTSAPRFNAILIAAPSYVAASLLEPVNAALAQRLEGIEYASSALVCSGYRLDQFDHPLDAFGLGVPHVEGRRVLAVSIASRKFPGRAPAGHVLLRTFVGGALQPELLDRDEAGLSALVHQELRSILGLRGEPAVEAVRRYDRAMPQYHVGHLDRVAEIESLTTAQPGLALAGNAYRGVGLPDCIHSGRVAADRLLALR